MKQYLKTIFALTMSATMLFAAVGCSSQEPTSDPASDEQQEDYIFCSIARHCSWFFNCHDKSNP